MGRLGAYFKITKTGKNTLYIVFTVITMQEDEFEMESEVEI